MELVIIAAISENNVIGYNGNMPWGRIKEDLSHFKKLTLNHPIIMGRNTFDSIGKPLDSRTNIVLSSNKIETPSVISYTSLDEAIKYANSLDELAFVIGGGKVYSQAINHKNASRLEITRIPGIYNGDTYFPEINPSIWSLRKLCSGETCDFVTYTRR